MKAALARRGTKPDLQRLISTLQREAGDLGIDDGVLYYGWPKFQDYEAHGHPVDLALLSKRTGLILLRHLTNLNAARVEEAEESISQAAATAEAQMLKSAALGGRNRRLRFDVLPLLYVPAYDGQGGEEAEIGGSQAGVLSYIRDLADQGLTDATLEEARSILEGAKALGRPQRRWVDDPQAKPAASALSQLEEQIAKFDSQQSGRKGYGRRAW